MKGFVAGSILATVAAADETASPVTKVVELLSGLQAKIIAEGEAAQKEYDEYAEWCSDRSKNLGFEIQTGESEVASLQATIEEETASASALSTKIEELASSIATDEADLKSATEIRAKEASDFSAEEAELKEVINTLQRAVGILSRELQKGGASMLQVTNAKNLGDALSAMVQASMLSVADHQQLTALIQNSQESEDDSMGAPAATVYENQSGGIIDTLGDLQEKAEQQLSDARNKEETALHNFQMLKQSLEDSLKFAGKDTAAAKKELAASAEKKASAEASLDVTSKDLAEDKKTKATLHQGCMTKATDFEATTKSRAEELDALAAAKKIINESTGGADSLVYGLAQTSFLQVERAQLSTTTDLANYEVVRFVRDLARKQHSPALAQFAQRVAAAVRVGAGSGSDPFGKVKTMIAQMIEKLESDGATAASHKGYCDKELSESNAKKAEQESDIEKLTTKLDQMSSRSAELKEQVAGLNKELAALAASQAEMDKMRQEEKATFDTNSAETKQGLEGVKAALKVLRDYYAKDSAHESAGGSASGIVGLLEVVESDFSKALAEMTSIEDSSAATYKADTNENEIDKVMKTKDVEHKTAEAAGLDKAVTETSSDRANVQAELDAVVEYLGKLTDMCVAKAEPYSEIKRRRDEEIAGLKEALQILEGEAVLVQQKRRSFRGVSRHVTA